MLLQSLQKKVRISDTLPWNRNAQHLSVMPFRDTIEIIQKSVYTAPSTCSKIPHVYFHRSGPSSKKNDIKK